MVYDVLLLDGEDRIALSVLRSLAKKSVNTVVAASQKRAITFLSKYCKSKVADPYPHPRENRSLFLQAIRKTLQKRGFGTVFLVHDCALQTISENRKEIARYARLPLPSLESMNRVFDKSQTLKLAADKGVPIPKTFFVRSLQELRDVSEEVTYPAVIRPRWSWVWQGNKAQYSRVRYVTSPAEMMAAYHIIHSVFPFPMVQEYIPGTGRNYSIAALYNNSHQRALCCIKVHRTFPVSGGNSVSRESVELDPRMRSYASRLLEALNWHGVAEVEFKLDPRDNVPKLMEINGRFWASMEVAIQAGVDFPYLLYRLTMDGDVPEVSSYKVGVKCRWVEGDLHHLFSVFRRKFGVQFPGRLITLLDFLKVYEKNLNYDIFDLKDLYPFLETLRATKSNWNHLA